MASNLKVDIVRPTSTNGSLSLKGDSGGSATTNGVTVNSSGNTSVTGNLSVSGSLTVPDNSAIGSASASNAIKISADGSTSTLGNAEIGRGYSTQEIYFKIGRERTGDGKAYLNLNSSSGVDYSARLQRDDGVNGNLSLIQTGTGSLNLTSLNNSSINLNSTGGVTTTGSVSVTGSVKADVIKPKTQDSSLTLQADVSGSGVTGLQIGVDPSNNGILISDNLTGLISAFANSTAPNGWLACDGSAISRTTYANLFAAISTTWGVGDGSTTFNLPDLRGAFLRGIGDGTINGRTKSGPTNVGDFQEDQYQRHFHTFLDNSSSYNSLTTYNISGSGLGKIAHGGGTIEGTLQVSESREASGSGAPRTGSETRPFNAGILYCIKF